MLTYESDSFEDSKKTTVYPDVMPSDQPLA